MALTPTVLPDGTRPHRGALAAVQELPRNVYTRPPGDWQERAARDDDELGPPHFGNALLADTVGRTIIRVEVRNPETGEWSPADETEGAPGGLDAMFADEYHNTIQNADELRRLHAWLYQVPGEGFIVVEDTPEGATSWSLYGPWAVTVRTDHVLVRDAPDDKGRRLPPEQVQRFWLPDPKWRLAATSPMKATLGDLQRYRAFARYERQVAESKMGMNGVFWMPDSASIKKPAAAGTGRPDASTVDRMIDYMQDGFNDADHPANVMPFIVWWGKDEGDPKWIDVGRTLDEAVTNARLQAARDYATAVNMPADVVTGGGVGQGNHWHDWLVDEKFFAIGVAPICDRIHHLDLTTAWLHPRLRLMGYDETRLDGFRVGYDPAPVIVRPDRSAQSLRYANAGLIGGKAARREGGYGEDDAPTPEDIERITAIRSRVSPDEIDQDRIADGTSDSSTVQPGPPVAAALSDRAVRATARRLAAARRQLIDRIHSAAEVAYTEAVNRSFSRVRALAHKAGRGSNVRTLAIEAADRGVVTPAVLAAVGMSEQELLHTAFDALGLSADRWLRDYDETRRRELAQLLGLDPSELPPPDDDHRALAVAFLSVSLFALAVSALRGDPRTPDTVAATIGPIPHAITEALADIAEGRTMWSPDPDGELPELAATGTHDLADFYATQGLAEIWSWVHGEPVNPFPPHEALDGLALLDPNLDETGHVIDDTLENFEDFPPTPYFFPGDHLGCTCYWDIILTYEP